MKNNEWVDVIPMTTTNPAFTSTSLGLISPNPSSQAEEPV